MLYMFVVVVNVQEILLLTKYFNLQSHIRLICPQVVVEICPKGSDTEQEAPQGCYTGCLAPNVLFDFVSLKQQLYLGTDIVSFRNYN